MKNRTDPDYYTNMKYPVCKSVAASSQSKTRLYARNARDFLVGPGDPPKASKAPRRKDRSERQRNAVKLPGKRNFGLGSSGNLRVSAATHASQDLCTNGSPETSPRSRLVLGRWTPGPIHCWNQYCRTRYQELEMRPASYVGLCQKSMKRGDEITQCMLRSDDTVVQGSDTENMASASKGLRNFQNGSRDKNESAIANHVVDLCTRAEGLLASMQHLRLQSRMDFEAAPGMRSFAPGC